MRRTELICHDVVLERDGGLGDLRAAEEALWYKTHDDNVKVDEDSTLTHNGHSCKTDYPSSLVQETSCWPACHIPSTRLLEPSTSCPPPNVLLVPRQPITWTHSLQ
jgi:hypothetical protein